MSNALSLFAPVNTHAISQQFGENRTCIEDAGGIVEAISNDGGDCPSDFAPLYLSRGMHGHNGIDYGATEGQPVYASHPGRVIELSSEPERGIGVGIVSGRRYQFIDPTKRNGIGRFHLKTRYWHLMAYAVKLGERVNAGQLIGWAGNTGLSSGSHLHFELKPVERVMKGKYRNAFPQNGYRGAIDPAPYLPVRTQSELEA